MDFTSLISTVSIAAAVSTAITFALKTWIKNSIEQKYKIEIENLKNENALKIESLKAQLSVSTSTNSEIADRQLRAHSRIVELIYRTRNMCRDICIRSIPYSVALIEELISRSNELEETLYLYRLELEYDKLFLDVHKYKNLVKNFCMKLADVKYFQEHNEMERADSSKIQLSELFKEIETYYDPVIKSLSTISVLTDGGLTSFPSRQL